MKRNKKSFVGELPIFSGSPTIVPGGFNLDRTKQNFSAGDIIPAGTLAIFDEQTRLVQIVKTAKVKAIDADDSKIVTLVTSDYYQPVFSVGDKVLVSISGTYAAAPSISKIEKSDNEYKITLSAAITGLAAGNILIEVVKDSSNNAAAIGSANALTIEEITVREYETPVDVTDDTLNWALYERRVLPIPASQKDSTGRYLKVNPHVKLSQSY